MWKKEGETPAPKSAAGEASTASGDIIAFVGKGVEVKGAIAYEGTVRVDGRVDGEIQTNGVLIVGEEAVITAKVQAGTVISKGKITGDVIATERVKLMAPAVLSGSIQAPIFSIEEGVTFDGTCEMTGEEAQPVQREQGVRAVNQGANVKRMTG